MHSSEFHSYFCKTNKYKVMRAIRYQLKTRYSYDSNKHSSQINFLFSETNSRTCKMNSMCKQNTRIQLKFFKTFCRSLNTHELKLKS